MKQRISAVAISVANLILAGIITQRSVRADNDTSNKGGWRIATDNLTGLITVPQPGDKNWFNDPNICDIEDGCPHPDDTHSS